MPRPRWILDLHPDFPSSAIVAQRLGEAIIIEKTEIMTARWPDVSGPVVGYGTMFGMTRLQRARGLGTAVFDDYVRLRCSSYYRHVFDLLARICVLVPFNGLPLLPLEKMFGPRVFVRSDVNYKLFPASELAVSDVSRWLDTYREYSDELVVVSEVVPFDREYRCFCRNGKVVCGSSYPHEPYRAVPDDVMSFAEAAAQRLVEAGMNMVTVDVGTSAETKRIVEIGGVNSWGLYGADVDAFIAMMEDEAVARAQ